MKPYITVGFLSSLREGQGDLVSRLITPMRHNNRNSPGVRLESLGFKGYGFRVWGWFKGLGWNARFVGEGPPPGDGFVSLLTNIKPCNPIYHRSIHFPLSPLNPKP